MGSSLNRGDLLVREFTIRGSIVNGCVVAVCSLKSRE